MHRLSALLLSLALLPACGTNASDTVDIKTPPDKSAPVTIASTSRHAYRDVILPAGTMLPLTLTTPIASDISKVADRVSATLTSAISVDGHEVVAKGARLDGTVTEVHDSGRVKGLATIAFRFTSLHDAGDQYELQAASVTHQASAKSERGVKMGVGADVSSRLTAPLTVRVRAS